VFDFDPESQFSLFAFPLFSFLLPPTLKHQLKERMSYAKPQHGGAADSYYQQQGQQDIGMQYQQPQQYQAPNGAPPQQAYQQYPPQQQEYNAPPPQQYNAPPPQYGKQAAEVAYGNQTFAQSFNVEKPKFNDTWAAILFLLTFAGFVAVSGLSIRGYSSTNQGGGIYNSNAQEVGLNTNTIVLL
jgi:hypothetical protein